MGSIVKLNNATAGYYSGVILQDISLTVEDGEIVGIFGCNGSGKTTLLRTINGMTRLFGGQVFIDNVPITTFSGNTLRQHIGYVPQTFEVDGRAPILLNEVIAMGRYGHRRNSENGPHQNASLLHSLITELGLEHVQNTPFGQLSGGQKKKTLIGRALFQNPRLLLLDEVFAWLDMTSMEHVLSLILKLNHNEKLTVILVAHDADLLQRIASRTIWLEQGKIRFDGKTSSFLRIIRCGNY
jgi:ABC-type cobalamin/Fe3+-siderophores transport system ATPase subunit